VRDSHHCKTTAAHSQFHTASRFKKLAGLIYVLNALGICTAVCRKRLTVQHIRTPKSKELSSP